MTNPLTPIDIDQELVIILSNHIQRGKAVDFTEKLLEDLKQLIRQLIRQFGQKVIGRYEKGLPIDDFARTEEQIAAYYHEIAIRDELKKEQHQRLQELLGEEKS